MTDDTTTPTATTPTATDATTTATAATPVGEGASVERASARDLMEALAQVYDPEIGIDIVALGLVYDTEVDDAGLARVEMTLTSPYCPMGSIIQSQAHAVCAVLPGITDVAVTLTFSPPWDPRTMASEEARLELGIY